MCQAGLKGVSFGEKTRLKGIEGNLRKNFEEAEEGTARGRRRRRG
jgi:hypothetical protein